MTHETETGAWPEAIVHSDNQSATHAHIDQSVNKALPWCVLAAAAAFLSLGIVVSDHARLGDSLEHHSELIHNAENRALDAQQNALITEQKCNSLEIEMARHGITAPPIVKPDRRE